MLYLRFTLLFSRRNLLSNFYFVSNRILCVSVHCLPRLRCVSRRNLYIRVSIIIIITITVFIARTWSGWTRVDRSIINNYYQRSLPPPPSTPPPCFVSDRIETYITPRPNEPNGLTVHTQSRTRARKLGYYPRVCACQSVGNWASSGARVYTKNGRGEEARTKRPERFECTTRVVWPRSIFSKNPHPFSSTAYF